MAKPNNSLPSELCNCNHFAGMRPEALSRCHSVCWEGGSARVVLFWALRAPVGRQVRELLDTSELLTHERMLSFCSVGDGNAMIVERGTIKNLTLQLVCCATLFSLLTPSLSFLLGKKAMIIRTSHSCCAD